MEIPFSRWHAAIPLRRSRRRYDSAALEPDQLDQLRTICREFRPFPQARAELVTESPDRIFRGAVGPYGKIKGATALIVFIGSMDDTYVQERVGYLGIMTGFGRNHRRKPLAELVTGLSTSDWPQWVKPALEAARIAPSAINRQPWRFYVESNGITVSVDNSRFSFGVSKRLDCGIAMLHIEVAALDAGVRGRWKFLEAPGVAKFAVESGG